MDGPYALLLKAVRMSPAVFAEAHGYSKQAIASAVQGTYINLSDRLVEDILDTCASKGVVAEEHLFEAFGTGNIDEAYHLWQAKERRDHFDLLIKPTELRYNKELSPAHFFMQDIAGSRDRFAHIFKLPPATLMRWEKGVTRGMPVPVENLLLAAGYQGLDKLAEAQRDWVEEFA